MSDTLAKFAIVGTFFLLFVMSFQQPLGQTVTGNKGLAADLSTVETEDEYYDAKWLASDYEQADVVAYIDSKEVISVSSSDESTDCSRFPQSKGGVGYCGFTMKAEIKELYKGKAGKTIEYSEGGEAALIQSKDRYLGNQVVFLERFEEKDGQIHYQVIDNSTRKIKHDVIAKMRSISKFKP